MVRKYFCSISFFVLCFLLQAGSVVFAQSGTNRVAGPDSLNNLSYPFDDEGAFEYPGETDENPLYLDRAKNIERKIEYDPESRQYVIYEKIGDMYYRLPKTMSLKDYVKYDFDRSINEYWRTRKDVEEMATQEQRGGLIPQLKIESEAFTNIFGTDVIDIRPQGYVEVQFGLESNFIGNYTLPERQRRVTRFDFDNQINMSVTGKIGDKVDMTLNYNTAATFDFENQVKIEYNGKEDEILKKIEAGNVSLPLNGTLIQGGTNLMGIKTVMQFGRLNLTTIVSQHKGESQVIETEGGAQKTKFEIKASDYDENRHFFLSKFFREQYNEALSQLPLVKSDVVINKVEVWITNKSQNFNSARDIVALVDLGEQERHISNTIPEFGPVINSAPANRVPHNDANRLYDEMISTYSGLRDSKEISRVFSPLEARGFKNGLHWEKIDQARKLNESEYYINRQLGFVSLNASLNNDEVLAIAYNFTVGDTTFQVGEFSDEGGLQAGQTLVLKLIKGTNLSPGFPTWDLMMKNVYNLGAYDLSPEDFDFNVAYKYDSTNTYINYMPEGEYKEKFLLNLLNLDNLNSRGDYFEGGDGMFDFVEGITVIRQSGRIIFPVLEPFGSNIAGLFNTDELKKKYAFSKLYSDTKTEAEKDHEHDKFWMIGSYKGSSSSEIELNAFNLAPGSVVVSAGSQVLIENVDYTVDYALGRVKIINQGLIESGTPIQVSTESQDLLSMQRKTMLGAYASYAFSDNFNVGGTLLYMDERPITNKVDLGEEPITNLMMGLDFQYRTQSKAITDLLNYLPLIETDATSSFSIEGEVAKLFPGNSTATGNNVYIDDFEGVETPYSMVNAYGWNLASTPSVFPESKLTDTLAYGFNRARLAWYFIDRVFQDPQGSSSMPAHIKADVEMRSNHFMRDVYIQEIFPGKQLAIGSATYQTILNLAYYPEEKGPYNFETNPTGVSRGIDSDGKLRSPETRWGGMMREVQSPNFEAANIEYIEFWVMDPFVYDEQNAHRGGDLYFDLGSISEDILKDSRKAFENGLPISEEVENVDTTIWGRVPTRPLLSQSFDNSASSRQFQDVGLDGLGDADERSFYDGYLNKLKNILSPEVYNEMEADPANDNFHYFRGEDYDQKEYSILERYKKFNNVEGNSPTQTQNTTSYSASSKNEPDVEDINNDNTLNEQENYYQYRVSLRKQDMEIGKNHIVDKVRRKTIFLANGKTEEVDWYQFKIPVRKPDAKVGEISDFKSIRFMRMYLTNFSDSIILRFATLNLIRSDWRKVEQNLAEAGAVKSLNTKFDLSSINIEENQSRKPINYILPPGIEQEFDPSNTTPIKMNEQSMLLKVIDLESGDAEGVYKDIGLDVRQYKKLKMEVHAEAIDGYPLDDYEMSLFIRMGTGIDNYYEYEIPLKLTPVPTTSYNPELESDKYIVWPDENRVNINLTLFSDVKMKRDDEMRKAGSTLTRNDLFEDLHTGYAGGKNIVRIKGNPSLGEVDVIYIGIKNPKQKNQGPRSVEVWVNELRLSDFDERGGWASNGRMSLRLADIGNLTLAGRTQSVGWGSINQTTSQRSLENVYEYDFAANFQLGKLLPESVGLQMPLFYSYSKSVATPEYNPLSSDIKLSDALANIESPEEREALNTLSQDVLTRESFNINNVTVQPRRKNADRKQLPTDIENFSVSYSHNKQEVHNVDIERQIQEVTKGALNYNYVMTSTPIEPFKKIKLFQGKLLRLIGDFNFNPLPEMISYRTDLTHSYNERLMRNNTGIDSPLPVTVSKDFLWNSGFDLRYNITRSLRFDFTSQDVARIDDPAGYDPYIDKEMYPEIFKNYQRDLWSQLLQLRRPTDYSHTMNVTYTIPISKFPLLEWVTSQVTYRGTYDWLAAPMVRQGEGSKPIGNTIRNSMNINGSANLSFMSLYNKVPYFREINQKFQQTARRYGGRTNPRNQQSSSQKKEEGKTTEVKYEEKEVSFTANVPKSIFHKLGTERVGVTVLNESGDTINGELTVVNANRINFKTEKSLKNARVLVNGTKNLEDSFGKKALDFTTRFLLGIRSARVSYTRTGGSELPGFLPQPFLFGAVDYAPTSSGPSSLAPSVPFLMGWQDNNYAMFAAEKGWLTEDNTITRQFLVTNTETWTFGAQVEPIAGIKIDVTGSRRESQNMGSFIQFNDTEGYFEELNKTEKGNFELSIFTLATAFREGLDNDEYTSELFDAFRGKNSEIIAARLNQERGWVEGTGYTKSPSGETLNGVSPRSTDVLIPAFLATYAGIDPNEVPLTARPGLSWIRPNWRVNYNGNPQSIDWMKDFIYSLNFNHSYKATYGLGQFETNLGYKPDANGISWARSPLNDTTFIPELAITSVSIVEDFSPLINIDIGFVNDLSTRFEMRRTRNLNFSFANLQMNEMIRTEFTLGVGYRFTGLDMIVKTKRQSKTVSNDINMQLALTSSNYKTIFRPINEPEGILQNGTQMFGVDFQAEYMFSDQLTLKLYYQYNLKAPHSTNDGYEMRNTKFGITFNYAIM
ncbi:MAG TPA: cell surface protein SprA [Prolixibacteraceae bacterium]|nr:cell surface protein SprA [Prolixibacteraceae bacterium]